MQAYLTDKPAETHKLYSKVMVEGERNRVLNLLRAGLPRWSWGTELATRFDEALLTIETIYAGDEKAEQARSTFTAEDRKTFRGEPYERAMAFYYRGILYLMEGDYENASSRAYCRTRWRSRKNTNRTLRFSSSWKVGPRSATAMGIWLRKPTPMRKSTIRRLLPEAGQNLLVLSDQGYAPVKYGDGEHKELLKVKGNDNSYTPNQAFRLGGSAQSLANQEDVLRQATTRGGREFDFVLEGKAKFKEGAEDVASGSRRCPSGHGCWYGGSRQRQ